VVHNCLDSFSYAISCFAKSFRVPITALVAKVKATTPAITKAMGPSASEENSLNAFPPSTARLFDASFASNIPSIKFLEPSISLLSLGV
jgi:hypothetical protein